MSPIRITPEVPICISKERGPTIPVTTGGSFLAAEEVHVVVEGKDSHYDAWVHGFDNGPGGIIESQRLTRGYNTNDLILTTPDDRDLSDELGLSEVVIDGVRYTAVNP